MDNLWKSVKFWEEFGVKLGKIGGLCSVQLNLDVEDAVLDFVHGVILLHQCRCGTKINTDSVVTAGIVFQDGIIVINCEPCDKSVDKGGIIRLVKMPYIFFEVF